jgi:hypothetical protein
MDKSYLKRRVKTAKIRSRRRTSPEWQSFISSFTNDDEVWEFDTRTTSMGFLTGTTGLVAIRRGVIVAQFTYTIAD